MPITSLVAFAVLGQAPIQTTCLTAEALLQPVGGALQTAMLSQVSKRKPRNSADLLLHVANGKHIKEGLITVRKASRRKAGGSDGFSDLTITKSTDVSSHSLIVRGPSVISNSGNGVGNIKKSRRKAH